jgi:hypothetical protein
MLQTNKTGSRIEGKQDREVNVDQWSRKVTFELGVEAVAMWDEPTRERVFLCLCFRVVSWSVAKKPCEADRIGVCVF